MAKPKLIAGQISRKRVGFVESSQDAHVMLEWARARALFSEPQELRVVVSEEIAPREAPEIVEILKIRGYEARDVSELFTKAQTKSTFDKDLFMTVLNPRVLFFKEKAFKKLSERFQSAYRARQQARAHLKDTYAQLNRVQAELKVTDSRIVQANHNITTILLIRAASKPPPLHLPQRITPEYLREHYPFLIDPISFDANPPVLKTALEIAEHIVQLRTNLGLPPAAGHSEIASLLSNFKAEITIQVRKLVTFELDKNVLRGEVEMYQSAIDNVNDTLPRLMELMNSKSTYGADGINEG